MPHNSFLLPPEWSPCSHVLLSWPHADTDWAYMLDEVRTCFRSMTEAIGAYATPVIVAPDPSEVYRFFDGCSVRPVVVEIATNDTWARDFGMITTISPDGHTRINDFKFNGWGLKFPACHDNLVTRQLALKHKAATAEYVNRLGFVLEGGSIDIDDDGTLLTTSHCLLSPNRNGDLTKEQIDDSLRQHLGCTRVLWVDHGDLEGDDTDSHIDTLARFLPGGIIACTSCDRPGDTHYEPLKAMVEQIMSFTTPSGSDYKIVELPIPSPVYDEQHMRLPATYANFLIVNKAVIVPTYGDSEYDIHALQKIKAAMPLYDVVGVDCRALIRQHGSLHCMTMQIPPGTLEFQ